MAKNKNYQKSNQPKGNNMNAENSIQETTEQEVIQSEAEQVSNEADVTETPVEEIQTEGEAGETALEVEEVAPVIITSTDVVDSAPVSEFETLLAPLRSGGTVAQKNLISALEAYLTAMKPGVPMESATGNRHQYTLWKTLSALVEASPQEEFKRLWSLLLAFFKAHEAAAFHDRYLFRFAEYWHQSEAELSAFQRILNLIKLTADPATRETGLKQVDLHRTLEHGFSEEARQRIVQYYH